MSFTESVVAGFGGKVVINITETDGDVEFIPIARHLQHHGSLQYPRLGDNHGGPHSRSRFPQHQPSCHLVFIRSWSASTSAKVGTPACETVNLALSGTPTSVNSTSALRRESARKRLRKREGHRCPSSLPCQDLNPSVDSTFKASLIAETTVASSRDEGILIHLKTSL